MSVIQTPATHLRDRPSIRELESIAAITLRSVVLIGLAMLLILVLLPAILSAVAPGAAAV